MFRFAEDTVYAPVSDMIEYGLYPDLEAIENTGFKIWPYQLAVIPKNTPFKYLGDYTGNIHLEVFGQELLFDDDIKAIVSSY